MARDFVVDSCSFKKIYDELGSVENQDSPLRLGVIQAFDG